MFGGVERGTNRCFLVPVKKRKTKILLLFTEGDDPTLEFPDNFTWFERHMLHQISKELGFHHASVNEDSTRRLVVSRTTGMPAPCEHSYFEDTLREV